MPNKEAASAGWTLPVAADHRVGEDVANSQRASRADTGLPSIRTSAQLVSRKTLRPNDFQPRFAVDGAARQLHLLVGRSLCCKHP